MPNDFDPLYHWLGIPPDEQPPHHYRLLGLALFESHPDVISMAADRQMAHVRNFQGGKHESHAAEVLNQLAAAQICLLNPARHQAYDDELRTKFARQANTPLPLSKPTATSLASMPPVPPPHSATAHVAVAAYEPAGPDESSELSLWPNWAHFSIQSPMFWQLSMAGLAFVLVLVVGWQVVKVVRQARRATLVAERTTEHTTVARPKSPANVEPPSPIAPPPQESPPVTRPPATAEPPAPVETPPASPRKTPDPVPPNRVVVPVAPDPSQENVPPAPPSTASPLPPNDPFGAMPEAPPGPAPNPTRRGIPQGATLQAARMAMLEIYGKELAQSSSPMQRKSLAEKLHQEARKFVDDPAGAYVLLMEARSLAIETAQPKLLLEIVGDLVTNFDLDALPMRVEALRAVASTAKAPATHEIIADLCAAQADETIALEKLDVAHELVELGLTAATKSGSRDTIKELTTRRDDLARVERLQQELATAQTTLANDPSDAAASLYVGRYLCLTKNDWLPGLAMLAKGSEPALATVATADLKQPIDATERAALADQWWAYAHSSAAQTPEFQHRAIYWYKLAEPELKGIAQSRVAQRLADTWTGPTGGPEPAIAPLSAAQARERQVKWAQWLKTPVNKTNKLGIKLMLIPPGQFRMGSATAPAVAPIEAPDHVVRITRPFYVGVHEVSVAQYAEFLKSSGHKSQLDQERDRDRDDFDRFNRGRGRPTSRSRQPAWMSTSYVQVADHPVVNVTWEDAEAFCQWLSKAEGVEYSLPTEAQWEYACRAGTESNFSFGDSDSRLDGFAWFAGNSPKSAQRVGQKKPNAWGLRDMHGNVAEWCADWFATYEPALAEDPSGPDSGTTRVVRGGHWGSRVAPRSALRDELPPSSGDEHIGFRVICNAITVPK